MSTHQLTLSKSLLSVVGPTHAADDTRVPAAATRWARRLMIALLLVGAAGFAGKARADGQEPPPPAEEEETVEPTEPTSTEDEGRSAWDWMISIMGDEGGSNDPETGTL